LAHVGDASNGYPSNNAPYYPPWESYSQTDKYSPNHDYQQQQVDPYRKPQYLPVQQGQNNPYHQSVQEHFSPQEQQYSSPELREQTQSYFSETTHDNCVEDLDGKESSKNETTKVEDIATLSANSSQTQSYYHYADSNGNYYSESDEVIDSEPVVFDTAMQQEWGKPQPPSAQQWQQPKNWGTSMQPYATQPRHPSPPTSQMQPQYPTEQQFQQYPPNISPPNSAQSQTSVQWGNVANAVGNAHPWERYPWTGVSGKDYDGGPQLPWDEERTELSRDDSNENKGFLGRIFRRDNEKQQERLDETSTGYPSEDPYLQQQQRSWDFPGMHSNWQQQNSQAGSPQQDSKSQTNYRTPAMVPWAGQTSSHAQASMSPEMMYWQQQMTVTRRSNLGDVRASAASAAIGAASSATAAGSSVMGWLSKFKEALSTPGQQHRPNSFAEWQQQQQQSANGFDPSRNGYFAGTSHGVRPPQTPQSYPMYPGSTTTQESTSWQQTPGVANPWNQGAVPPQQQQQHVPSSSNKQQTQQSVPQWQKPPQYQFQYSQPQTYYSSHPNYPNPPQR